MITYRQFAEQVRAAGLQPRLADDMTPQWQIRGGHFVVNFYPETKRGPRYYVNGTTGGRSGDVAAAIAAARKPPRIERDPTRRVRRPGKRARRRIKQRLLNKDPRCHWCGRKLSMATATLDHVIPVDRGGSNGTDNLTLACKRCNGTRSNQMPEVKTHG